MVNSQSGLDRSLLALFLNTHYSNSSFLGRIQVGCRGRNSGQIIPAYTCTLSEVELTRFMQNFYFSPQADYYICGNSFSGVRRVSEDLFAFHNIVIDVDCHGLNFTYDCNMLFDALLDRFNHSLWDVDVPMPTSIVKTGRGLQFWWALEGISFKFKGFYEEVLDFYMDAISFYLKDGPCEDFSMFSVDYAASRHVLGYFRLPLTLNTKVNRYVSYTTTGKVYLLMDLFEEVRKNSSEAPSKDELRGISQKVPVLDSLVDSGSFDFTAASCNRLRVIYDLRSHRNRDCNDEERNNLCFMIYNATVTCYGHNYAYEKMSEFNLGFKVPMTLGELNTVISSAKKKGGYHYSNEQFIRFLGITQEEYDVLGFHDLLGKFSSQSKISQREAKKSKVLLKKNERDSLVVNLYDSGKSVTTISKDLSISFPTVSKILKENHRGKPKNRNDLFLSLYDEGKNLTEIAGILGCSLRTVQRMKATAV